MGVSEQELLWVHEYLTNGCNAARAARAVGYAPSTANSDAPLWVQKTREKSTKPRLWDMVHKVLSKKLSHLDATEERIIQEYVRLAMFDIEQFYHPDTGELLHPKDMPEDARRCIGAVDTSSSTWIERIIKIKIADKKGALDSLARIRGMFNDKVQVTGFADFLAEISKNAADEPLVGDQEERD